MKSVKLSNPKTPHYNSLLHSLAYKHMSRGVSLTRPFTPRIAGIVQCVKWQAVGWMIYVQFPEGVGFSS